MQTPILISAFAITFCWAVAVLLVRRCLYRGHYPLPKIDRIRLAQSMLASFPASMLN
jgi:hypothetical protein